MFTKPEVGSVISVTAEFSNYVIGRDRNICTYSGVKVLKSEMWDQPNSFRIATGNKKFPIAVLAMKYITHLNGDKIKQGTTPLQETRTVIVKGSKGNEYVVTIEGNTGSCTCPGFTFHRGRCKHVTGVLSGK